MPRARVFRDVITGVFSGDGLRRSQAGYCPHDPASFSVTGEAGKNLREIGCFKNWPVGHFGDVPRKLVD
jgi:hypothetical protein